MDPQVTHYGFLSIQVCVPSDYTDEQVADFAEKDYPCGTDNGWHIRPEGHELLAGCHERVPCDSTSRPNFVHIMLDA